MDLTRSKLFKKLSTFYEIRRFIPAFTTARHLSLPWVKLMQSMPPSNLSKIRFNIILPSTLGSSKWSSPFRIPCICTSPLFHTSYMSPSYTVVLIMESESLSETSAVCYQSTRHHILRDCSPCHQRYDNLKPYIRAHRFTIPHVHYYYHHHHNHHIIIIFV